MAKGQYNNIGRVEPGAPTAGKSVSGLEDQNGNILELNVRKCIPGGTETQTADTATATAKVIQAASDDRISLMVYNNGVNTVYLSFAGTAVYTTGIPVEPGAMWEEIWSCEACSAVTETGSSDIRIRHFVKAAG